jgi:hypothetical protein
MKLLKRAFGTAAILAVVVVAVVWIQDALAKPDMKGFNPQEMGRLEASMWRSYYEGHWLRLAGQTMEGACGQFGFSWWDASRLSVHAALSALYFRSNTDDPRCLPELEKYYTIIAQASGSDFDIRKVAALELDWWKARRREVGPKDYGRIIAQQASLYYGVPEASVLPGSVQRAEAMAYRDSRRDGKPTEADWQEIARRLDLAYTSLKEAIRRGQ